MSRDIFVQDLPPGLRHVRDIPGDFVPAALPVTRTQIIEAVCAEAPHANIADSTWITIEEAGKYHIEISLRDAEPVTGFAFHVLGGRTAEELIGRILGRLGLRALDPARESCLFDLPDNNPS